MTLRCATSPLSGVSHADPITFLRAYFAAASPAVNAAKTRSRYDDKGVLQLWRVGINRVENPLQVFSLDGAKRTEIAGTKVNAEPAAGRVVGVRCRRGSAARSARHSRPQTLCQRWTELIQLRGYELKHERHQGLISLVYRGVRARDGLPVIVKILRNE